MLATFEQKIIRQKSINAGMNDHVAKPIEIDHLWETLAEQLYRLWGMDQERLGCQDRMFR